MPFLIAAGTSLALPVPKPTIFAPGSPTTTSAEKLMFLPPLTTLVTRLIETTCSFRFRRVGVDALWLLACFAAIALKLQSGFTSRIGQRLHAAVIQIPAAVEDHRLDALCPWRARPPVCRWLWRRPHCRRWLAELLLLVEDAATSVWPCGRRSPARRYASRCGTPPGAAAPPCPCTLARMRCVNAHRECRSLESSSSLLYLAPAPVLPTFFRSASPV